MLEQIKSRLTPRHLAKPGPTVVQVEQAVSAACAAPDHGRLRPWRFVVITGEGRSRLGDVLAKSFLKRDPSATEEQLQREREKPLRAPLIVAIACVPQASAKVPEIEQLLAVGAAAQNFQLAIHALGFGCQWKTGAAVYDADVKQALGFQPADHLIGLMYVGSIAEAGHPRESDSKAVTVNWP